jgi:hypothetical protein
VVTAITGGNNITWTDNCDAEDGFEIWVSINDGEYALLAITAANITTYDDTVSSGNLSYKVRAYKGLNYSYYSEEALAPSESETYKIRVESDGGAIIDQAQIQADIDYLKSISVYDELTNIYFPYGGYNLRTVGVDNFITKLYDIKGVAGDITITTESLQPKYGAGQINGINVITTNNSLMGYTAAAWKTAIMVNAVGDSLSSGYMGAAEGAYLGIGTTGLRYRDLAINIDTHTLISKTIRIDSILIDGTAVSVWRNKTASAENPITKMLSSFGYFGQRISSGYWNGQYGTQLLSTNLITTTKRALIEDYYITLFAIT